MQVDLTYINANKSEPIECTYAFPLETDALLSSFRAAIGDRVVEAKVTEIKRAEERYEDTMAAGNTVFMAQRQSS